MATIETLAKETSDLYAALLQTGRLAIETLGAVDRALLDELLATFDSEDAAAAWLVSRTIGFGGSSALELLGKEERDRVMRALNQVRYGLS